MSTESNRKWSRIDRRMARARELLDSWINGKRDEVLARIGNSARELAAIVHAGDTPERGLAATEICEAIARERVQ